jgi:hypothetical protein
VTLVRIKNLMLGIGIGLVAVKVWGIGVGMVGSKYGVSG